MLRFPRPLQVSKALETVAQELAKTTDDDASTNLSLAATIEALEALKVAWPVAKDEESLRGEISLGVSRLLVPKSRAFGCLLACFWMILEGFRCLWALRVAWELASGAFGPCAEDLRRARALRLGGDEDMLCGADRAADPVRPGKGLRALDLRMLLEC